MNPNNNYVEVGMCFIAVLLCSFDGISGSLVILVHISTSHAKKKRDGVRLHNLPEPSRCLLLPIHSQQGFCTQFSFRYKV